MVECCIWQTKTTIAHDISWREIAHRNVFACFRTVPRNQDILGGWLPILPKLCGLAGQLDGRFPLAGCAISSNFLDATIDLRNPPNGLRRDSIQPKAPAVPAIQ